MSTKAKATITMEIDVSDRLQWDDDLTIKDIKQKAITKAKTIIENIPRQVPSDIKILGTPKIKISFNG